MFLRNLSDYTFIKSLSILNYVRPFNTVAVLMYHNVTDALQPSYRSIRVKDFRDQMLYLKKECEVLAIEDLISMYRSGNVIDKSRKPRVVITMDDGYRDNYTHAFPVLKEFGLPATLFIVTDDIHWSMNADEGPKRTHLSLREMKEMRKHGITFCSHTQSHPDLSRIGYEEQKKQILNGMRQLYDCFPDPEVLQAFAYPFGEYNYFTLEILKELKFKVGLTVWHDLNGQFEDPLRLKRLTGDGRNSIVKFAGQLNPYVFNLYKRFTMRAHIRRPLRNVPFPHLDPYAFEI